MQKREPRPGISGLGNQLGVLAGQITKRTAFAGVEAYCMFLGYPRSGHSLVGALLNAHPDAVIAHELDALSYLARGVSRSRLFALLLRRDRWFIRSGAQWYGYDFRVPNQWQGRFRHLKVIGDKKGGTSTSRLLKEPDVLAHLARLVKVPVCVIHVVRNPYDNISTMSMRNGRPLERNIDTYFSLSRCIADLIAGSPDLRLTTVRHEDIIARPEESLQRLCRGLGLDCPADYVRDCAGIVFSSPSQTRHGVDWPQRLVKHVHTRMAEFPFLEGYGFASC
jgi:hypothetical protein